MADAIPTDHVACAEGILSQKLGLNTGDFEITQFTSAKNNNVYLLSLNKAVEAGHHTESTSQVLTTPIPTGTKKLVLRIPKPGSSVVDHVRIRNEVAILHLASRALTSLKTSIVPKVFGWKDDQSGPDWILEEFKEGQVITQEDFLALDTEHQQTIMAQVAQIVKLFQDFPVQDSLIHGGVTFDDKGVLSSTEPVIPMDGPFKSYRDLVIGMCNWQLKASDRNTHIRGWKDTPGLRERIDKFFEEGLDKVLANVEESRPVLIHGDLSLPNILFDTSDYRITGLLDFDFAHLTHPISESLFSLFDFQGLLESCMESNGPVSAREAMLNGFPDDPTDDNLKMSKRWDQALQTAQAKRVSEMPGAGTIADVWWFSQEIVQPFWFIDRWIARQTEEQLEEMKGRGAEMIDKYLKHWGY